MEQIHHPTLDQLRLAQRRRDAQDRLIGEEHGPLGHGVYVTRETQVGQRIDERGRETATFAEPRKLPGAEVKIVQVVEHLLEPRGQEEIPLFR